MAAEQVAPPADAPPAGEPAGILINRDFAKLWWGETISQIGTQVTQFALPLVAILTLKATVLEVGVLNALRFVPVIIVAILAGVVLDRRRRRPVLIGCSLASAVIIGLVPIAQAGGVLSLGLLYAVALLAGTLSVCFDVGALSYVPYLVGRRHLGEANSRLQASIAFAGIAGPGLAGLLVGLITAPVTLTVDAASYLFSAAGLLAVRRREPAPDHREQAPIRQSLAEGFHAVYGTRLLRVLLAQSATLNIGFGALSTVFTVYALRTVGLSATKLGLALAALQAGALLGALGAARVQRALGLGRTLVVAILAVSASPLLLLIPHGASPGAIVVFMLGWLGHGTGIAIWNVNTVTLRQAVTPSRVLARMNATYRMLLFGALPVGSLAGGLLGAAFGLHTALLIAALVLVTPIAWIFFSPVFRLTEMPSLAPEDQ
ncbi:MAG TPA: MFS transporter [Trebonia sp.]|jgi:MFS family permease|nr:MFS transporter [Trebonia sp.]